MGVEVEVTDTGATGLVKRLSEIGQGFTFGVHEDAEPYPDGRAADEVASLQEFGGRKTPRRSFLRGYVDSGGSKEIGLSVEVQVGKVVDGAAADTISEKSGEVAVKGVKNFMSKGIRGVAGIGYEGTTAGTSSDLDDSGHLRSQITSKPGGKS